MLRTTKILAAVGLALSAAGCVTVPAAAPSPNRSPEPAPGPAHTPPSAGEDGPEGPEQAPVKQALSQLPRPAAGSPAPAPGGGPHTAPPRARTGPGSATASPHAQAPPGSADVRRTAPERAAQDGAGHEDEPAAGVRLPAAAPHATGVCALGETYGRWDAHSAEARICRAAHGR